MTSSALGSAATLPVLRHGGGVRRFVLAAVSALLWLVGIFFLSAGFVPEIDGDETELSIQVTFVALGLIVSALPVLLFWLPQRRQVTRAVDAVLATGSGSPPPVPPVEQWLSPARVFQRMRWSAYTAVAIPLISLLVFAVAYGISLDEDAAAIVCLVFAIVPTFFLIVTLTLPARLRRGLAAGLATGQVVPVQLDNRVDQQQALNAAFQSWFEATLPDGQRVMLRTPVHFTWGTEARGIVDSPELVLVIGRGGHQGALLVPSRPEDALWLLGPVPQVRVPRTIVKAFAELSD